MVAVGRRTVLSVVAGTVAAHGQAPRLHHRCSGCRGVSHPSPGRMGVSSPPRRRDWRAVRDRGRCNGHRLRSGRPQALPASIHEVSPFSRLSTVPSHPAGRSRRQPHPRSSTGTFRDWNDRCEHRCRARSGLVRDVQRWSCRARSQLRSTRLHWRAELLVVPLAAAIPEPRVDRHGCRISIQYRGCGVLRDRGPLSRRAPIPAAPASSREQKPILGHARGRRNDSSAIGRLSAGNLSKARSHRRVSR